MDDLSRPRTREQHIAQAMEDQGAYEGLSSATLAEIAEAAVREWERLPHTLTPTDGGPVMKLDAGELNG